MQRKKKNWASIEIWTIVSPKTALALKKAGFTTVGEVAKVDWKKLYVTRNFGPDSYKELKSALDDFGVRLEGHFGLKTSRQRPKVKTDKLTKEDIFRLLEESRYSRACSELFWEILKSLGPEYLLVFLG